MTEETKSLQMQIPEYESVEQKLVRNILKPVADFIQGIYGGTAGYFRIPTSIRKGYNHQAFLQRKLEKNAGTTANGIGTGFGIVCPMLIPIIAHSEFNESALYTFLATNLASGIYELGRLSRSKLENKILKESKNKEKK